MSYLKRVSQEFIKHDIPLEWCEWCVRFGPPPYPIGAHLFVATAHKHKRIWYKKKNTNRAELLYNIRHILRLCQYHHDLIEYSRELTNKLFKALRGNYS